MYVYFEAYIDVVAFWELNKNTYLFGKRWAQKTKIFPQKR